jgi:transposase
MLRPVVDEIVVSNPRANRLLSAGSKTDQVDAGKLARLLRLGQIRAVYKVADDLKRLKELVAGYEALVEDVTRCKNRLKALYRGVGVNCRGRAIYQPGRRAEFLSQLTESGRRERAQWLSRELDELQPLRREAKRAMLRESTRQAASQYLQSIPGIGPVRVAQLLAQIGAPERFRTKRQLWSYSGLAVRVRTSSEYEVREQRIVRKKTAVQTLGLTREFNHRLKAVFKGAAEEARKYEPFKGYYEKLLVNGLRAELARLTVARKVAAVTLHLWKHEQVFNEEEIEKLAA